MEVTPDWIVEQILGNRMRIMTLEEVVERLTRGENLTPEKVQEIREKAVEQIQEDYPELDLGLG